jgi:hypothetical protein
MSAHTSSTSNLPASKVSPAASNRSDLGDRRGLTIRVLARQRHVRLATPDISAMISRSAAVSPMAAI